MIALSGSKVAACYHSIGSRVKYRRTGIDDQTSDYVILAWTYQEFDEVARAFLDSELCRSKVRGTC